MDNFVYYTPTKVFFGKGEEAKIGEILASYGFKRIMLHYGKGSIKRSGLYDTVVKSLNEHNIEFIELGGVEANPKLSLVLDGVKLAKENKVELILAVGGGSVIDSSKAIAAGAMVDFSPWEFSLKHKTPECHLPVATILTIAASGSDMSDSCVITNSETGEKRGFNTDVNRPLFSILNPELTYSVNKFQTGCGTTDIMMHTLERYLSKGDDFEITDNISLGLLKAVMHAGRIAKDNPYDYNARATLLWANSLSHNGLTGCGRKYLMSVHQMEHEISGMFDYVAHGAGLAVIWPAWALNAMTGDVARFKRLAYEVMEVEKTNDPLEDIKKAILKLRAFFKEIGMPTTLKELNIGKESLEPLAKNISFNHTRVLHDIIDIDYDMALKILTESYE